MFTTQIRRLRDTAGLLQALVDKEYALLTGDSPVEVKAADAENDGGGEKKTPNLSRMLRSRLQKLVNKNDDGCVSSYIFID